MAPRTLLTATLIVSSFLVSSQAFAGRPNLTPEQLTKARESASQLNPPVDFDAMLDEGDRLDVECTGDLTRKARIIICGQKIENAQIKVDTEVKRVRNREIDKENAELIREIQQRIKENK